MRTPRKKPVGESAVHHCISHLVHGLRYLYEDELEVLRLRMWALADFCQTQIITYNLLPSHFHILLRTPAQINTADDFLLQRLRNFYGPDSSEVELFEQAMAKKHDKELARLRQRYHRRMGDVSVYMKELKEGFSKWFNAKHQRRGTLWSDRFTSLLVEDKPSEIRKVAAYIDLNSVRAGLTDDPLNYRFCGYTQAVSQGGLARAGLGQILHPGPWSAQQAEYRQLLFGTAARSGRSSQRTLDPKLIAKIYQEGGELSLEQLLRQRVRYFTEGIALGSAKYVNRIFQKYHRKHCRMRRDGAHRMRGGDWGGMTSLRDFKEPILPT